MKGGVRQDETFRSISSLPRGSFRFRGSHDCNLLTLCLRQIKLTYLLSVFLLCWLVQTENVRDPNLGMKMSVFHISEDNSLIRMISFKNIVLKLVLIHLWLIAINLCFIFIMEISQISISGSDFWSQPKMSGFLHTKNTSGILDPRIPTFWNSENTLPPSSDTDPNAKTRRSIVRCYFIIKTNSKK
jgi:hypothetical protein